MRPCGRLYDYSVISYPVRLLSVSLSGNELNRVGLFLSNNYSEKYFLFFGVVSLLNYQGSLPDLSSRSLLPQQIFFTASANTILSKKFSLVNTFFAIFFKKIQKAFLLNFTITNHIIICIHNCIIPPFF